MEARTKKLLISKVNEIKDVKSLSGLEKEITPLLDKIPKDECINELKQLQLIINEINNLLSESTGKDSSKNLIKAKKEVADVLCDLLCI